MKYKFGLAAILIGAVCAAVVITHWPALSAQALSFDDQKYLVDNVLVQNPSLASAKQFLTEVLEPSTIGGYYQPLTMISLMLDYAAGGRADNLRPFHITSLALHTANTALIIVLLYLLFGNIWAAAAAGLLFGVHPMTVEPIPWVGERKTLLAAFFSFWSLILYVCYAHNGKIKFYIGCFLMYLLALMSKPTSTPLPAVMLLMDYWPLARLKMKSIFEKIPLFVLGAIFAIITYVSQHRTGGTIKYGPEHIVLVLCHNIIFYLYKIVLPVNLSSHYAFPKIVGLSNPMILGGVIGTCVLIPLLLVSLWWTRAALTGWLIFFAAILPAMQIIGFSNVIASDKYAYLPSIGLLMIVTSLLIWFGNRNKIRIAAVFVVVILAGSEAFATQRYLVYWQDSVTLYNHMLTLTPDAEPLYNNRGLAYSDKGQFDYAISDFNKAIEINPNDAATYKNRGNAYAKQGKYGLAINDYNRVIEIRPVDAEAYNNRANAYKSKGEYDSAIFDYNTALEIDPRYAAAYYNRGNSYVQGKGDYEHAIFDYTKAIEINPRLAYAYTGRGIAYKKKGQLDLAIADYSKAIAIDPGFVEAYNNRGTVYHSRGEYDLAIADYDKALKINPKFSAAYLNKAIAYERAGRKMEAIQAYKAFIQYAPVQYVPDIEQLKQKITQLEQQR